MVHPPDNEEASSCQDWSHALVLSRVATHFGKPGKKHIHFPGPGNILEFTKSGNVLKKLCL